MVRDEADVIEGTLRHMAGEGLLGIFIADNNSTDGTAEIIQSLAHQLPCPVIMVRDPEVGYYQSRKMSKLAASAAGFGAKWIVPFDADELWLAPHALGRYLGAMPDDVDIVKADLFHHLRTAVDVEDRDPFRSMVWRQREPAGLPKVAFRWRAGATIHAGNHGVDLPGVRHVVGGMEVRHFPYRSAEQMTRKAINGAEAYRATDLPLDVGAHWRQYGDLHDRGHSIDDVFREHFFYTLPTEQGLVRDPAAYRRWE